MGYIGNNLSQQVTQPATDFFSGTGSATSFTLTRTPTTVYSVEVVVNNVRQNPQTSYYLNGNTLIFFQAPPSGSNNIYVVYNPQVTSVNQPGYGTVGSSQLGNISTINNNAGSLSLQTNGTSAITIDPSQNITVSGPIYALSSTALRFGTNGSIRVSIDTSGNLLPSVTATQNLGSTSTTWKNIYTNDLHLNNESNDRGNDVDGTTGNWTIQEGRDNLYIINNKSGKKYAFVLKEIQ